jgi:imidazolonepropionase-like amidohydrolase
VGRGPGGEDKEGQLIVRTAAWVVVLVACSGAPPQPRASNSPRTIRRTFVASGRVSGHETATYDRGHITTTLDVLQNGRGPHIEATLDVAADFTITRYDARGHLGTGTPVAAHFDRHGAHAAWRSAEDTGSRDDVQGPSFFWPDIDLHEAYPLLVHAALAAGGTIPLLPVGQAHVAKLTEATVTMHGETRALTCYAITGLDYTPLYTWLNADGTWFGFVSPWDSLVPEGWEAAIAQLEAKQEVATRAADAALYAATAHRPPPAGLAYTHARVLDVEHGSWLPDQTVVVVGDVIMAVGRDAPVPAGAEVVDLAGRALVPGFIDMHVHVGDADGALNIASGVTTVRDLGNDPDKLDDYKARYDAGTAVGPRLYRWGLIEGRNANALASKVTAETVDEAKAAVKFYADRHYDGIKIYNAVRPDLVPVLVAEAHARGMPVTGHIPSHMIAHEAVRAGFDGIEHVIMLALEFLVTHDTDTLGNARWNIPGEGAAALDLDSAGVRDFIGLLETHGTVIDPTLDAFEDLYASTPGKITPGLEATVARMPAVVQRGFLSDGLPLSGDKRALYRRSWAKMLALVKAIHDAGVPVVVGTDMTPGLMFHHELALMIQVGLPPAEVLRMATIIPARALGADRKIGSVAPGKLADLVVIDGDPLAHIEDTTHVISTMKGGVVFSSAPLCRSVGVRPYAP